MQILKLNLSNLRIILGFHVAIRLSTSKSTTYVDSVSEYRIYYGRMQHAKCFVSRRKRNGNFTLPAKSSRSVFDIILIANFAMSGSKSTPTTEEDFVRKPNPFSAMRIDDNAFLATVPERQPCPRCHASRRFFCYTCYIPLPGVGEFPAITVSIGLLKVSYVNTSSNRGSYVHTVTSQNRHHQAS